MERCAFQFVLGLLLTFAVSTFSIAEEELSVDLGVSVIHQKLVSAISNRFGLQAVETKGDGHQTAQTSAFLFAADKSLRTPQIFATIGVQTLMAPGTGAGPFIAVSFAAVPRLQTKGITSDRLMEFCNQWNLSPYPIRLAVVDGRLTSLAVMVLEPGVALTFTQTQREFTRVLQSVPRVLLELRRNGLI